MSNNLVDSKILLGVFFAVLLAVSGLASCGGGGESATINSPTFSVSLVPSRTTGVAPLAVFFDATGTTDAAVTSRPFHDLEYRWDFGDASAGTWANGTQQSGITNSKNKATGAVAAHVFETPGLYTVALTVFDGVNTATKNVTITVTDPAIVFAATTACVANGALPVAGVSGCPATATLFYNASVFDTAMSTAITAGARRILFRRGDTFTASATHTNSTAGPGIIGAYGAGALPYVAISVIGQYANTLRINSSDWRVMDLAFDGTGTTDQFAIGNAGTPSQITILRVTATNLNSDVNLNNTDQLAIVDSNFSLGLNSAIGSYGVWCGTCTNVMLLGNSMYLNTNTTSSHNIRLQGATKFVVSNSTQIGGNLIEPITVRGNTQYGVLSDNKFVDNIVTVKPQNSTANEFQRDIIFERNWFLAGSNTIPSLSLEGSGITVRNNIFDLSLAVGYRAISVFYGNTVGSPIPDLVNIYNNTIYNSFANNGNVNSTIAIRYLGGLDTTCHSEVKNNLAYSPNTTNLAPVLIQVAGGSCVITGASGTFGNSSDTQIKSSSPLFASATPSNPVDFIIGIGSYAHDTGVSIPVFSDFFRAIRPLNGAIDSGAVEIP